MSIKDVVNKIRSKLAALPEVSRKPWVQLDKSPYLHATDDPTADPWSSPVVGRFDYLDTQHYIQACNPAAMTEVLAYIDSLHAKIQDLDLPKPDTTEDSMKQVSLAREAERMHVALTAAGIDEISSSYPTNPQNLVFRVSLYVQTVKRAIRKEYADELAAEKAENDRLRKICDETGTMTITKERPVEIRDTEGK